MPDDLGSDAQLGLDRRAIIKRAAAAGAVAWTAPLLVDSFASPAAAATVAPGCYSVYFPTANTCGQAAPVSGVCNPPNFPGTAFPTGFISGAPGCADNQNPTFSLAAGISCVFVDGQARQTSGGGTCVAGTGGGTTAMTFTRTGNWSGLGFRMRVSCGGVACP